MAKALRVGSRVTIPAGTRVTRAGETTKRSVETQVTVRDVQTTKTGKTKITWKSNGLFATATV